MSLEHGDASGERAHIGKDAGVLRIASSSEANACTTPSWARARPEAGGGTAEGRSTTRTKNSASVRAR